MIGYSYSRLWLLPKRQVFVPNCTSLPFRRYVSAKTNGGPTPSQLLRFAVIGSVPPSQDEGLRSDLDEHLREIFLQEWPTESPPPPLWSSTSRKPETPRLRIMKRYTRNLQQLQVSIEKNVDVRESNSLSQRDLYDALSKTLKRCEKFNSYGEILSVINGTVARLERLNAPVCGDLYALGMYYACLAFCESALRRHLRAYLAVNSVPLDLEFSLSLVRALLSSFRTLSFRGLGHDVGGIAGSITGENALDTPNLHSVLYWSKDGATTDAIGEYLSLLAKLRSNTVLQKIWNQFLKNTSSESTFRHFQSAYIYATSLVELGNPSEALAVLCQVSKHAKDTLPGVSKFKGLHNLLQDGTIAEALPQLAGKREYLMILEAQLGHMEKRLGLSWHSDPGLHTSVSDSHYIATEKPLLTIDGDSAAYSSRERLIAEILALGSSKSVADLGVIANSLDDHEGALIPVSIPSCDIPNSEFYWAPQRSPIELPGNPSFGSYSSKPWSPSTLGLIRVVPDGNGIPLTLERSLNLMQLGLLFKREMSSHEHQRTSSELEESGHIVAWDRASGQFLIVFVGKEYREVDPRITLQNLFGSNELDSIAKIIPFGSKREVPQKRGASLGIGASTYRLELDRGPDLVF